MSAEFPKSWLQLAAQARLDLELARGVVAVVAPNLGHDACAKVGQPKLDGRHTSIDELEQEQPCASAR